MSNKTLTVLSQIASTAALFGAAYYARLDNVPETIFFAAAYLGFKLDSGVSVDNKKEE